MAVLSCPAPQSNEGFVEKQDPVFEVSWLAGYRKSTKEKCIDGRAAASFSFQTGFGKHTHFGGGAVLISGGFDVLGKSQVRTKAQE